ncbi:hypothetical protein POF45_25480 [Pseudomonas sp. 681]|uniref:Peptidase C80 domain-containing protein n=1 Tax=Pseudomonas fungipugnans TaxID=3024217 RepID=A0ABT6QVH1_9PSED|nr:hypothetical protein [Pseudomonas sp. 681]MDI2594756.1 hypothetical protein [Pseudomonas sp. 681]
MHYIICMIIKDSGDNDIHESSGSLFYKLAKGGKNAKVYRFHGAVTPQALSAPALLLSTNKPDIQNIAPNIGVSSSSPPIGVNVEAPDDDSEICLYINAHGNRSTGIGGYSPGDVAAWVIKCLGLSKKKFKKIVFLACHLAVEDQYEISINNVLDALSEINVQKIVMYSGAMTILSPRNFKLFDPYGSKGKKTDIEWNNHKKLKDSEATKANTHSKWYQNLQTKFRADIKDNTNGGEQEITTFINTRFADNDTGIWWDEGADIRTTGIDASELKESKYAKNFIAGDIDLIKNIHTKALDHLGRRFMSVGSGNTKQQGYSPKHGSENPLVGLPKFGQKPQIVMGQRAENPIVLQAEGPAKNGYIYLDYNNAKVVWEKVRRPTKDDKIDEADSL